MSEYPGIRSDTQGRAERTEDRGGPEPGALVENIFHQIASRGDPDQDLGKELDNPGVELGHRKARPHPEVQVASQCIAQLQSWIQPELRLKVLAYPHLVSNFHGKRLVKDLPPRPPRDRTTRTGSDDTSRYERELTHTPRLASTEALSSDTIMAFATRTSSPRMAHSRPCSSLLDVDVRLTHARVGLDRSTVEPTQARRGDHGFEGPASKVFEY